MEAIAIVAYVVCDDTLKLLDIKDDVQTRMSTAEIMTTAIVAAVEFSGNLEKARKALKNRYYIPHMLSKSQINRRLLRIKTDTWNAVMKTLNSSSEQREFIVDSYPVSACKITRSLRRKLYADKEYVGYCAAKKEYYVGLKAHVVMDIAGLPVETLFLPASYADITGLKQMNLSLPRNSSLYGDKAYNDYDFEDQLVQTSQIHLQPIRKKNSKRRGGGFLAAIRKRKRRLIESAFSCIEKLMPRSIHAVTQAGFEMKAMLFVIAYAFNRAML
jgi:hypothetical protein